MQPIESLGYNVYFEENLQSLYPFILDRQYTQILVLVDRNTNDHCLPMLQEALSGTVDYDIIEIDPGEENKNIDFCIGVWKTMLDFGADRNAVMINLGGGVVTDLGGFAASTYKRGIDFIHIPTTLLSQVDASVGGKTGIDLDNVKNIIGTFAQPQAVFVSTSFLGSLDDRQILSGFAEIVKHGLIRDSELYAHCKSSKIDDAIAPEMIHRSVGIKNEIILQDPQEKGLRKILNFGHTIGHAVEGYSLCHDEQPLLHGEAVAIGMICEAYLSSKCAGLSENELQDIVSYLQRVYPRHTIPVVDEDLIRLMQNDKKNAAGRIGFALLEGIGACTYNHFLDEGLIRESLNFYRNL